ncbi:hypothetical protein ACJMK2_017875 [Sinanodonta woodiana]|uniref:Uncharacterized protein n=1 Tax=Sinanodonta woodiana TaxID=1069815 RepID=A0ABD3UBP3_SINWO
MLNVDDLKDEFLICEVCQEEFDEEFHTPRVLPCLHTFCHKCLEGLVRDWTVVCPTCRIKHTVPGDNIKNFPKENTRRSLRDFVRLKRKSHQIHCKDCPDSGIAAYFCKECQAFMCAECTHAHLRNFMSRNHQIANFEQLRKYGLETFQRQLTCSIAGHDGQILMYFCAGKNCQKPLCKMCTVLDHDETKGHVVRKIQDVYDEQRQIVSELMKKVEDKIAFAKNVMQETETEIGNLENKEDMLKREIDIEMDAGVKMLEIRRRELKDNLTTRVREKKSVLQKQTDYLRYYLSLMTSAREFSSHSIIHSMPAEFVQLTRTISDRLAELRQAHLDACPLENSYIAFDKIQMGQEFKTYVLDMGKIRSTAIFPPKTLVEPLEAPLGQETEVLKVFLYDAKGRPQKDSFDAIVVEIKDSKGNIVLCQVQDAKTVDGCYKVICKPTIHGTHRAKIRVLGRSVNEEGFRFTVRAPGEIDKRFGDILCVGFVFDHETVHIERSISNDGKVMRSDVETLRRMAGLRTRNFRAIARGRRRFPWELENSIKERQQKEKDEKQEKDKENIREVKRFPAKSKKQEPVRVESAGAVEDREKIQDQLRTQDEKAIIAFAEKKEKTFWSKKLKKYTGCIGSKSFKAPGKFYWEVHVHYRIHVTLLRNALLFEIGIGRLESAHTSFYVGSQTFAWSFSGERCGDHKQVCQKFRHRRVMFNHQPITQDTAGSHHTAIYGFLLDMDKREWTVIDRHSGKILHVFTNIDTTEPLWPIFGTYNPYSVHVELTLRSGREITSLPDTLRPPSASSKTKASIHKRKQSKSTNFSEDVKYKD